MSEWQPIETAETDTHSPCIDIWNGSKRYTDCLWATPEGDASADPVWCYCDYERGYGWCLYAVPNPTHWMPVPEPPEVKP